MIGIVMSLIFSDFELLLFKSIHSANTDARLPLNQQPAPGSTYGALAHDGLTAATGYLRPDRSACRLPLRNRKTPEHAFDIREIAV